MRTQKQINQSRERLFIIFVAIVFLSMLIIGSLEDRKDKYKVNPELILKNIHYKAGVK